MKSRSFGRKLDPIEYEADPNAAIVHGISVTVLTGHEAEAMWREAVRSSTLLYQFWETVPGDLYELPPPTPGKKKPRGR